MGWDICTIGRHHLDLKDTRALAKTLSERLDINVDYGYDNRYRIDTEKKTVTWSPGFQWKSLGKFTRKSGGPVYLLDDARYYVNKFLRECAKLGVEPVVNGNFRVELDEEDPLFTLECENPDHIDTLDIRIYEEVVDIWPPEDPGRWSGLYHFFDKSASSRLDLGELLSYRMSIRRIARALGCDYVYQYSDQGPSGLIDGYTYMKWEQLEEYIQKGAWIDKYHHGNTISANHDHAEFQVIDVARFLTDENAPYSKWYSDVLRDDFSDLDKQI